MGRAAGAAPRTLRQRLRTVRGGLFEDSAFLLQAGVCFPQAFQVFLARFVMDFLLLTFPTVIFPAPGV
jgi:hypothetical protein